MPTLFCVKKIEYPSSININIETRKKRGKNSINKKKAAILLNILTEKFKCF